MLDMNSSPLLWEAQLAERRREVAALKVGATPRIHHRSHFRTALADLLAHVALHIDGRAVSSVVARHPNPAGHS